MSIESEIAQMMGDVLEAAQNMPGDAEVTVRTALRNAGYFWQCPHCDADTPKPTEEDVNCDDCGLTSGPRETPKFQVTIRAPYKAGEYNDPTPYRGYADTEEEALGHAHSLFHEAGHRASSDMEVDVREVVYHGPERSRIGYVQVIAAGSLYIAFDAKSHDDEAGTQIDQFYDAQDAHEAVLQVFQEHGPFSTR